MSIGQHALLDASLLKWRRRRGPGRRELPAAQPPYRLREGHALDLHHEAEHVAPIVVGPEAAPAPALGEDDQRGIVVVVTGVGFTPQGRFLRDGKPYDPTATPDLRLALHIGALCNDARLVRHQHEEDYTWEVRGDPTEGALVVAAGKAEYHKEMLYAQLPRIDELPFSSKTKFMATFHQGAEGQVWVFVKGALETVLEHCPQIRENAIARALEAADRELVLAENHRRIGRDDGPTSPGGSRRGGTLQARGHPGHHGDRRGHRPAGGHS